MPCERPAISNCVTAAIPGSSRPALASTGARSRTPYDGEYQPSDLALVRSSGEGRMRSSGRLPRDTVHAPRSWMSSRPG